MLLLCACALVNAQSLETVYINPDGSVTGTSNIQRDGNVYTLTGNITGAIKVQKSFIVINGAGYALTGSREPGSGIDLGNGVGQDPSRPSICNVTVKNLKLIDCYYALGSENTDNNTFIGNYIQRCDTGVWITGSSNNTLIHNTIRDCTTGVSINYGSGGNVFFENNIINNSFLVWLSPAPTVDRNYWSDYTSRYPNATEVDSSGVWDTAYNREAFVDYHPLTQPYQEPASAATPTPQETPTATPLPTESPLGQEQTASTPTLTGQNSESPTPTITLNPSEVQAAKARVAEAETAAAIVAVVLAVVAALILRRNRKK